MNILELPFMQNFFLPVLDILIVWFFVFQIYRFLEGSRAIQIVKGIALLLIIYFISGWIHLDTVNWILTYLLQYGIIALIIVFQPEFRRMLIKFGESRVIGFFSEKEKKIVLDELTEAVQYFSKKKIGALFVFKMKDYLGNIEETGVKLDAVLSAKLLTTIFNKKSLLHDGATLIYFNRVVAAACILPLTDNPDLDKAIGTRHRAALGQSEESDAIIIVVSEETGRISIVVNGKLDPVKPQSFRSTMEHYYEIGSKDPIKIEKTA
jgi:diadenylate cyclase